MCRNFGWITIVVEGFGGPSDAVDRFIHLQNKDGHGVSEHQSSLARRLSSKSPVKLRFLLQSPVFFEALRHGCQPKEHSFFPAYLSFHLPSLGDIL
ncbi:hypothetical protein SUGI_1502810 [Cryptomeria japonica]|uniref:Uncharacterized protein n=1 Tax=Cryptomeria japonica TaxID=3369 RepID=A0AAD3RRJ1_CRYJA|nr:hypothetical protein SUGI_1487410 [Cryptomeria japonica]GLJ59317.1 hypothetical protein SUGI_1502810 [Cryptomeria japonica]